MTAAELRAHFNYKFGLDAWPDHFEVNAETYANICQYIFDKHEEAESFGTIKRVKISLGPNNGIYFKGVELILKEKT